MKKHNTKKKRKGFTLVELLAVIVILAIVVGIAIPSVTKVINNSKINGFETAVEAAGGYLAKQAQLMNVDYNSVDYEFKKIVSTTAKTITYNQAGPGYTAEDTRALWSKLGFKSSNVNKIKVAYNTDGTACIKVVSIPQTSEYYTANHYTIASGNVAPNSSIKAQYGKGC